MLVPGGATPGSRVRSGPGNESRRGPIRTGAQRVVLSVAYGSHVLRSSDTFETDESREALVERLEAAAAEHAYKVRVIRKENADYVAVSRPWRPPRLFWAAVLACALALVALAFVIGWFFWL